MTKNVAENGFNHFSLEAHDKKFHPNGYRQGDTCKFRDRLESLDKTDDLELAGDAMKKFFADPKKYASYAEGMNIESLLDAMEDAEALDEMIDAVSDKDLKAALEAEREDTQKVIDAAAKKFNDAVKGINAGPVSFGPNAPVEHDSNAFPKKDDKAWAEALDHYGDSSYGWSSAGSGSTCPHKITFNGREYYVKKAGMNPTYGKDACKNEVNANRFLRLAGLNAPDSKYYHVGSGRFAVSESVDTSGGTLESKLGKQSVKDMVKEAYPIMALAYNMDVMQNADNAFIGTDGKPVYIDNGSTFGFSARGERNKRMNFDARTDPESVHGSDSLTALANYANNGGNNWRNAFGVSTLSFDAALKESAKYDMGGLVKEATARGLIPAEAVDALQKYADRLDELAVEKGYKKAKTASASGQNGSQSSAGQTQDASKVKFAFLEPGIRGVFQMAGMASGAELTRVLCDEIPALKDSEPSKSKGWHALVDNSIGVPYLFSSIKDGNQSEIADMLPKGYAAIGYKGGVALANEDDAPALVDKWRSQGADCENLGNSTNRGQKQKSTSMKDIFGLPGNDPSNKLFSVIPKLKDIAPSFSVSVHSKSGTPFFFANIDSSKNDAVADALPKGLTAIRHGKNMNMIAITDESSADTLLEAWRAVGIKCENLGNGVTRKSASTTSGQNSTGATGSGATQTGTIDLYGGGKATYPKDVADAINSSGIKFARSSNGVDPDYLYSSVLGGKKSTLEFAHELADLTAGRYTVVTYGGNKIPHIAMIEKPNATPPAKWGATVINPSNVSSGVRNQSTVSQPAGNQSTGISGLEIQKMIGNSGKPTNSSWVGGFSTRQQRNSTAIQQAVLKMDGFTKEAAQAVVQIFTQGTFTAAGRGIGGVVSGLSIPTKGIQAVQKNLNSVFNTEGLKIQIHNGGNTATIGASASSIAKQAMQQAGINPSAMPKRRRAGQQSAPQNQSQAGGVSQQTAPGVNQTHGYISSAMNSSDSNSVKSAYSAVSNWLSGN